VVIGRSADRVAGRPSIASLAIALPNAQGAKFIELALPLFAPFREEGRLSLLEIDLKVLALEESNDAWKDQHEADDRDREEARPIRLRIGNPHPDEHAEEHHTQNRRKSGGGTPERRLRGQVAAGHVSRARIKDGGTSTGD